MAFSLATRHSTAELILQFGAQREIRTLKIWLLRPTRMPIPSSGRKNIFESTVMCLVGSFKFLPPDPQAFQSMMGVINSLQIMDAVSTGDYLP